MVFKSFQFWTVTLLHSQRSQGNLESCPQSGLSIGKLKVWNDVHSRQLLGAHCLLRAAHSDPSDKELFGNFSRHFSQSLVKHRFYCLSSGKALVYCYPIALHALTHWLLAPGSARHFIFRDPETHLSKRDVTLTRQPFTLQVSFISRLKTASRLIQ